MAIFDCYVRLQRSVTVTICRRYLDHICGGNVFLLKWPLYGWTRMYCLNVALKWVADWWIGSMFARNHGLTWKSSVQHLIQNASPKTSPAFFITFTQLGHSCWTQVDVLALTSGSAKAMGAIGCLSSTTHTTWGLGEIVQSPSCWWFLLTGVYTIACWL